MLFRKLHWRDQVWSSSLCQFNTFYKHVNICQIKFARSVYTSDVLRPTSRFHSNAGPLDCKWVCIFSGWIFCMKMMTMMIAERCSVNVPDYTIVTIVCRRQEMILTGSKETNWVKKTNRFVRDPDSESEFLTGSVSKWLKPEVHDLRSSNLSLEANQMKTHKLRINTILARNHLDWISKFLSLHLKLEVHSWKRISNRESLHDNPDGQL